MQQKHTPPRDGPSDDRATRTSGRDRGVSEIVGVILLFGLLIIVLTLIQANAVPDANKKLEFQHNERLHGDFVDLDADFEATAATGNGRATVVETGLRYPPRFFLFNPPPAEGAIRTGASGFTIQNAVAQGNTETDDYWDGGAADPNRFVYESRTLGYTPSYNVYAGAPVTTYTHGAVVNEFRDGTVRPVDDAAFVNGRTISLVALDGDRDVSQVDPLSLEATPLSTNTRTVRVTDDGSPIVLTIRTDLSASTWSDLLSEEPNVVEVRDVGGADAVEVELQQGVTYELQLAKIGVGPGADDVEPAYLTTDVSDGVFLETGRPSALTVEVRDAFNGPAAGVDVSFSAQGGTVSDATVTTDDEGQATVGFTPDINGNPVLRAEADLDGSGTIEPHEEVEIVINPRDEGTDDFTLNPIGSDTVLQFADASVRQPEGSSGRDVIDITFNNTGSGPITIDAMRMNFYFAGSPGADASQPTPPEVAVIDAPAPIAGKTLDIKGAFTPFDPGSYWVIDPGQETLTIELFEDQAATTSYEVNKLDFLILTLQSEGGKVSSYIISAEDIDDTTGGGGGGQGGGNN